MDALFGDAGALGADYAAVDWSATPLGPVETWSTALRSAVELTLATRFPVTLLWGAESVLVYNAAYVDMIGDKHPAALGSRAEAVFPEVWDVIGPLLGSVMAGQGAVWNDALMIHLERRGFAEECWFAFSYSAVKGDDGTVEGVIDIVAEHTREVLAERRLEVLARLGAGLAAVDRVEDLAVLARAALDTDPADLPAFDLRLPGLPPEPNALPASPAEAIGARPLLVESRDGAPVAWLPLRSGRPGPPGPSDPAAPADASDPALLVVALSPHLSPDADYLQFLRLAADIVAQALDRATTLSAERAVADAERRLSEVLQHSLLTTPAAPGRLGVSARYQAAADVVRIGGDWHDSFALAGGELALAVGDVGGHDQSAAAAMGQLRNLLRGIALVAPASPADILTTLDRAVAALGVEALATTVLAVVEEVPGEPVPGDPGPGEAGGGTGVGTTVLRWSNAGHPPPALIRPDGEVELLAWGSGPLLGLDPDAPRPDHRVVLEPGSSVVLYTDGLIERRGSTLDAGLDWLERTLRGRHALSPDALCDLLLASAPPGAEDDIALLVLRT